MLSQASWTFEAGDAAVESRSAGFAAAAVAAVVADAAAAAAEVMVASLAVVAVGALKPPT